MKFLKTIAVNELKHILNEISEAPLEEEMIKLDQSFNRVVSRDIKSNIDVPHFRKSSMDGYAVIAEDTFGAEEDNLISLELIEKISAGDIPKKKLRKGQCSYVSTGAAIPDNANGVVMVEYTETEGDKILISNAIAPGTNIVNIGYDVKKNEVIVKRNSLIELPTMGIFASCGINQIPVYKSPLVSLISTGNEIISPSLEKLDIGKIYDVNSTVLKKAIELTGARVNFLGIVKDDFIELKKKIDDALGSSDVIILSGGTSKGEGDLGPRVLEEYENLEILVHGVRIKPGKPIIFAKLEKKIIFILPGYPTSALSCYYVFIEDFLRKLSRYPPKEKNSKELQVGERIYGTVGRHEFKTVQIREIDGIKKIFPIKTGSEAISTMFYADGYIEIDELESIIEKGDIRRVFFF
jgi:molybdenum cofactor synthesis domain-containing protein